ncbi:MAG: TAXI family TRAP transporter solute-binding subunit [Alcaligenaceae bacterium]|jgi:TRAP transporter TAXI family solute receptor|nr:TAXI family TRAP transporter solute-binding subunit [Alcaligenaceae bacterium]HZJ97455.1 TAXI family TRAP transporter solute-binding subunit [Oligella sp.]
MSIKKWIVGIAASAMLVTSGTALAQRAQFVSVLTGGQSGVYYPVGVALAQHYAENIDNVRSTAQVTKASAENMNLLQAGRGEIAFSLADTVEDAWNGREEAGFSKKLDNLRSITRLYNNYVQIIANPESGISTIEDLKGKRISVGAARSGTELNARAIFKAAGMDYSDFSKVEYLSFGESVELMKNRQIDATLQSAGLGVASIRDLASAIKIVVVAIPEEIVANVGSESYIADVIPAGTYDGQTEDVPTAAIPNFLISHSGVSDDLAYEMTKVTYEKLDNLKSTHNAINTMDIKNAVTGMPAPIHPGAERYFKEQGIIE